MKKQILILPILLFALACSGQTITKSDSIAPTSKWIPPGIKVISSSEIWNIDASHMTNTHAILDTTEKLRLHCLKVTCTDHSFYPENSEIIMQLRYNKKAGKWFVMKSGEQIDFDGEMKFFYKEQEINPTKIEF